LCKDNHSSSSNSSRLKSIGPLCNFALTRPAAAAAAAAALLSVQCRLLFLGQSMLGFANLVKYSLVN
jgi:hypothetical protein